MLLPPRPNDPDQLIAALDPQQAAAVRAPVGPVRVLAGAGTGKTRAITHRIAYQSAIAAMDPRTVLALTFTTRAAGEMRHRLTELGTPGVQARTFHSAALRQASYFWPRAYGSELPRVIDNRFGLVAEATRGLRLEADTAALRDLLGEISWAKVSNVTPEDYPQIAAAAGREVSIADPEAVARIFDRYEDIKRDRGIDFDDILLCAVSILAECDEIAAHVRQTYRHFVVDEYQDTSPIQQRLLELWLGERDSVCVVGDPAQTIHSFAGARADYLLDFPRRYPNAARIELVRDYRSTPQVVTTANHVLSTGGAATHVELIAQRPAGPEPVVVGAADESTEAELVAEWLAACHANTAWSQMAVLFRINAQSPALEQALSSRQIPYLVRGGERFYERSEVRRALGMLRAQAASGSVLAEELDITDPLDIARSVLEIAGWQPEPPAGAGQARERWESLASLWAVLNDLAADDPDFGLLVGRLADRAANQLVPQADGVTLTTLHSAKGLEWDAVAITGLQEGSLPFVLATTASELAEERRLFYVGITRARRDLHLSWSSARASGGRKRRPSRFLDGLRPQEPEPTPKRRGRQRGLSRCRTCSGALTSGAERKLGRHHECESSYDEELLKNLKAWRKTEASERKLPAYCVFTDATLTAIAEATPTSPEQLLQIKGVGAAKCERYGDSVLSIITGDGTR